MIKDKQEHLYKEYPKVFGELSLLKRDGGLTVGDGWFSVLDALCERISNLLYGDDLLHNNEPTSIIVYQVKEKFGTLRFYLAEYNCSAVCKEKIDEAINDAVRLSGKTCEKCGKSGDKKYIKIQNIPDYNWTVTLCDSCFADVQQSYNKGEKLYVALGRRDK